MIMELFPASKTSLITVTKSACSKNAKSAALFYPISRDEGQTDQCPD